MATTTTNLGLTKPDGTDLVDIAVLNTNFDKIDANVTSIHRGPTPPTTPLTKPLWWDTDSGTLYVYVVGTASSAWMAATSDPINIGVVANQTERDAQYPTPAQGMRVFRTDLGVTQTYYGLYNVSTNPGGRDTAGWYDTEKTIGLVPINSFTTATAPSASSTNALGVVTIPANTTSFSVNGLPINDYARFVVKYALKGTIGGADLRFRSRISGTDHTINYFGGGLQSGYSGSLAAYGAVNNLGYAVIGSPGYGSLAGGEYGTLEYIPTANPSYVTYSAHSTYMSGYQAGSYEIATQSAKPDGFTVYISSGTMSGTVQIFGVND